MPGVSGVGISFGADRIYDVLNALDLYPSEATATTKVMFANMGETETETAFNAAKQLRQAGISVMVYPDNAKMKKQFGYADDMAIPYVAIIGETEIKENKITLKEMATGTQEMLTVEEAINKINSL